MGREVKCCKFLPISDPTSVATESFSFEHTRSGGHLAKQKWMYDAHAESLVFYVLLKYCYF